MNQGCATFVLFFAFSHDGEGRAVLAISKVAKRFFSNRSGGHRATGNTFPANLAAGRPPRLKMKRIHIIGRKNSGKTTLVVELVSALTDRGYRVGTIKHTHHDHELDTPEKDSYRHRKAGTVATGILSRRMNAIFWPTDQETTDQESTSTEAYQQFDALMSDCDVILVEGDSQADALKLEVWRAATGTEPMAKQNPDIKVVITDDPMDCQTTDCQATRWQRSDVASLVTHLESYAGLTHA